MTTPDHFRNTGSDAPHAPVLVREVVEWLRPHAGGLYVDATVGAGGHAAALLGAGAGRVIGLDRDRSALELAARRLEAACRAERLVLVHADYRALPDVLRAQGAGLLDGVVADLGVSSMQLDESNRGFSFREAGPLDMRMDRSSNVPTLADRLAQVDEATLADVIYRFGEERQSRRVARAIVRARERGVLTDTAALASVVRSGAGGRGWQRLDPATRTFQALRIWVNQELEGLDGFLSAAVQALRPGGRLAVIAFHSLEDRIVKHGARAMAAAGLVEVLTRRPVVPTVDESDRNRRARSARLRVMEKAA